VVLRRDIQAFERVMTAVDQIEAQLTRQERQLEVSLGALSELLEEVRAQSQAIFILIDRLPPP